MLKTASTITALLALATAFAAPANAQQDLRHPDTVDAARQSGSTAGPDPSEVRGDDLRNPDQRAPVESSPRQDLRSPDTIDASRDIVTRSAAPVSTGSGPGGGFDWGDAGIGAAGMLGLVSLAAGVALVGGHVRRRRRYPAALH